MLFFFSSRRRHTRFKCDWSSDVCSSDLMFTNSGFAKTNSHPIPGMPQTVLISEKAKWRSEERRVGKSVDLGGRRIIKKKKRKDKWGTDSQQRDKERKRGRTG